MFISEAWFYTIVGIVAAIGLALLLALATPGPADEPQSAELPQQTEVVETPVSEPTPEVSETVPGTAVSATPSVHYALDGVVREGEYRNMLDADGFQVHWMNDSTLLRVGLVSPGTGYLAIGFDPDRRMKGANFILGAVNGIAVTTRDDYGVGLTSHAADTSRGGTHDIVEAAGRESDGGTMFEFVIPLDSGDEMDKPLEPGLSYRVLVAYHTMNDSFDAVHSRYGTGDIRLDPVP
jgi:hypothetical protein